MADLAARIAAARVAEDDSWTPAKAAELRFELFKRFESDRRLLTVACRCGLFGHCAAEVMQAGPVRTGAAHAQRGRAQRQQPVQRPQPSPPDSAVEAAPPPAAAAPAPAGSGGTVQQPQASTQHPHQPPPAPGRPRQRGGRRSRTSTSAAADAAAAAPPAAPPPPPPIPPSSAAAALVATVLEEVIDTGAGADACAPGVENSPSAASAAPPPAAAAQPTAAAAWNSAPASVQCQGAAAMAAPGASTSTAPPPDSGDDSLAVDWAADGAPPPPPDMEGVQATQAPVLNTAWGRRGRTAADAGGPPARRSKPPWADRPATMEEVTRHYSSMSMADLMRADCGRGKGGGKGGGAGGLSGVRRGNYSYGASTSGYSAPGRSV